MMLSCFKLPEETKLQCNCTKGSNFGGVCWWPVVWDYQSKTIIVSLHQVPWFFWVMTMHSPLKLPKKNSVNAPSAQIFLGSDSLKCQHKNRSHRQGQKLPPPGKQYLCLKMYGETAHDAQCSKSHLLTKVIDLILEIESFVNKCAFLKGCCSQTD